MLGVDKMDQLVSYYSFLHKSVKWWKKVFFFWIVEVVVVNSYIIYKEQTSTNGKRPITHLAYRRRLIETHSDAQHSIPRACTGPRTSQTLERLQPLRHFMKKGKKHRDCAVCSSRQGSVRHLSLYKCSTCSDNPALCPSDCFKVYHTKRNI